MRWEVFMGRKRRRFSPEFKAESVALVRTSKKSTSEIAIDLGVGETALRRWIHQADVDAGDGGPEEVTSDEKQELTRLRRDDRLNSPRPSSSRKANEIPVHWYREG
ncbi:MAG: transposase [Hyphomicrobiaceae bacterium]|jgi:transposase